MKRRQESAGFMFQLTKQEFDDLRSRLVTSIMAAGEGDYLT